MPDPSSAGSAFPPAEVILFDLPQALRVTGDDREILREIIDVYLEDLPHMIRELRAAFDSKSASAVELHAHSLKGASANVGGQRVRAVAEAMEKAARAGRLDESAAHWPNLERETQLFASHLRELPPGTI